MKVVSFHHEGTSSSGVLDGDVIEDCGPNLLALLEDPTQRTVVRRIPLNDVTLGPPVPRPTKIICVGINYDAHRLETGREAVAFPTLFTRFASTLVAHEAPLVRPVISTRFDYEGELAVVMGRRARHVPREAALDYVAGWSCFNDGSVRDWQRHTSQFTPGKNFDGTGGFGPWIVTRDELPDPSNLSLTTRVNDRVLQEGHTSQLIFDVPALIAYITTFTTLETGDVIATGTPSGVGDKRDPPIYLKAGDVVTVTIDHVGALRNPVVDEARP